MLRVGDPAFASLLVPDLSLTGTSIVGGKPSKPGVFTGSNLTDRDFWCVIHSKPTLSGVIQRTWNARFLEHDL